MDYPRLCFGNLSYSLTRYIKCSYLNYCYTFWLTSTLMVHLSYLNLLKLIQMCTSKLDRDVSYVIIENKYKKNVNKINNKGNSKVQIQLKSDRICNLLTNDKRLFFMFYLIFLQFYRLYFIQVKMCSF